MAIRIRGWVRPPAVVESDLELKLTYDDYERLRRLRAYEQTLRIAANLRDSERTLQNVPG